MASKRSQPRSRKRRRADGGASRPARATVQRPAAAPRRAGQDGKDAAAPLAASRTPGAYRTAGERPPSLFGGLPVSEIAILLGGICAAVGYLNGGGAALIVGIIVCALGVAEVTAREHFSGYRSHTLLLAAFPAAAVEFGLAATTGGSGQRRLIILLPAAAVFALCCWLLRRRFLLARQARITRAALTHR